MAQRLCFNDVDGFFQRQSLKLSLALKFVTREAYRDKSMVMNIYRTGRHGAYAEGLTLIRSRGYVHFCPVEVEA